MSAVPTLSHLDRLEAESIHILREVAAAFRNPVMLYSVGKDSSVLLHLLLKAFAPAVPPIPLLHVDTRWKFREMIAFRDRRAAETGVELRVHINPDGVAQNVGPFSHGATVHTDIMKTQGLKQALDQYKFDAAIGGARRDEEKARAKERVFSFRNDKHRWDPKHQRPELWNLYNARIHPGESVRAFPLSNWTELDIWLYIYRERIPVVPLYFAAPAPGRRTRRRTDHGRRRTPAAARGRGAAAEVGALPHAGLLSADRRHRVAGRHPGEDHRRDAGGHQLRAPGPRDRPGSGRVDGAEEVGRIFLMEGRDSGLGIGDSQKRGLLADAAAGGAAVANPESPIPNPDGAAVKAYLRQHESKPLLRFITCGSVDDGKSTLIGRLLHDSKRLFDDQLAALESDSRRHGTQGARIDYALLLDGLAAEREQGITIDVAYRYFDTERRKYIVADCPGHAQYTRNMATGASTADVAVVLVDARKGLQTQTRRHSYIVSLLGLRHVVLAVNKMDLVDFDHAVFDAIVRDYRALAAQLGIAQVQAIPLSALEGDNLSSRSSRTPWYDGPSLLEHLDTLTLDDATETLGLRLPVQYVNRPNANFRGFAGTVAAGEVRPGDAVVVLPSARRSTVARVLDANGDVAFAAPARR